MLSDLLRYDNPSAIAMMFNDVHGTSIYPVDFDIVKRQPGPGPSITFTLQFKHPIDPIYPHRFTGSTTVSLQRIDLTEFFGRSLTMDMFYPTTVHDVLSRIMMGKGDVFDLTEFTNRVLDEEHVILTPKEDSLRWIGELHLELQDPANTLDIRTLAPVTAIDPLYIDRTDYTVHQLTPYKYLGDLGPIIQMGIVVGLVDGSRVTIKGPGDIPGGQVTLSNGTLTITSDEIVSILRWGNYGGAVSRYSFMDCVALVDVLDSRPTEITDFSYMFQGCVSLNSPALVNWQTRNVHDAQYMFAGCSVFNQDLSLWCVRNVPTEPEGFDLGAVKWTLPRPVWGTCPTEDHVIPTTLTLKMTNGRIYTPTVVGPITGTDAIISYVNNSIIVTGSEVAEVLIWDEIPEYAPGANGYVFEGCVNLISVPSNLPNWVYDTASMFKGCTNFNSGVSGWDVSNVTNMSNMFSSCIIFNRDLSTWNMVDTVNVSGMFRDNVTFDQDLSMWDVSTIDNMDNMFNGTILLDSDLSKWCVTKITEEPVGFSNGCVYMSPDKHPIWGACPAKSTLTKPGSLAVKRADPIATLPKPGSLSVKRVDEPTKLPKPGSLSVKRADPENDLPKPGTPAIKRERLSAIYPAPYMVAFKQIDT